MHDVELTPAVLSAINGFIRCGATAEQITVITGVKYKTVLKIVKEFKW